MTRGEEVAEACALFGHSPEYQGLIGICVYCFAIQDDDEA